MGPESESDRVLWDFVQGMEIITLGAGKISSGFFSLSREYTSGLVVLIKMMCLYADFM